MPIKLPSMGARTPTTRVARFIPTVHVYERDKFNARLLERDRWPTREDLESQFYATGRIVGDCDDSAFLACYLLADMGVRARVIIVMTEPVLYEGDTRPQPRAHMIAEDAQGNIVDNRFPGRVLTRHEFERTGYAWLLWSGFFEFGEVAQWRAADNWLRMIGRLPPAEADALQFFACGSMP